MTNRYTSVFQGRLERGATLAAWHFICTCPRCSEPADLGNHTDSLVCRCSGLLLPGDRGWLCEGCGESRGTEEVARMEEEVGGRVSRATTIAGMEALMQEHATTLHTDHHIMMALKLALVRAYGRTMAQQAAGGQGWSLKQVRRKVELCKQLLAALARMDPGLGYTRGEVLCELAAPQLVLLQHSFSKGLQVEGEVAALLAMVEEARTHLELFEEAREEEKLRTVIQLLEDVTTFHKHIKA